MLAAADEAKPAAALDKAKQPPTADEAILPPPAADEAIPQAANEALSEKWLSIKSTPIAFQQIGESGDFSKFFSSLFLSSFLITMVSLSTTTPFLPFTAQNASTRIPPPNTFRYTNHCHSNQILLLGLVLSESGGLHKSEQLSAARDQDDDSDVLIECRDMYKSFGEKKILNGVSFKVRGFVLDNGFGYITLLVMEEKTRDFRESGSLVFFLRFLDFGNYM
ncbi:Protein TRIGALACTOSYLDIACYLGLYCEROL 3 [Vigna angularis]|uniref:Protein TRIGALACTOSYLDIACYLGLYCEROL 3 n=1 Tax=Phaseolus angularis TaxID=3914 RepID=A0A8T0JYK2_PHAAN|nr:Protein TRIGALACTOSYLDIACYLGLYCEROL 3 [Vigna angularis]